jgi:hypothetical protein
MIVFGAYAFLDGVFLVVAGVRAQERHQPRWWALVLQEIAGVIAGVLLYIVAFWSIVTGVLEIAAAIRLRRELQNEWLLILSGTASALLGILLVACAGCRPARVGVGDRSVRACFGRSAPHARSAAARPRAGRPDHRPNAASSSERITSKVCE